MPYFNASNGWLEFPEGLPRFPNYVRQACLDVERTTGTVELQVVGSDGNWRTFETITAARTILDVANTPQMRIRATGDALFQLTY